MGNKKRIEYSNYDEVGIFVKDLFKIPKIIYQVRYYDHEASENRFVCIKIPEKEIIEYEDCPVCGDK